MKVTIKYQQFYKKKCKKCCLIKNNYLSVKYKNEIETLNNQLGAQGQEIKDGEKIIRGIQVDLEELTIKLEQKESQLNAQKAELEEVKNHKYSFLIKNILSFLV